MALSLQFPPALPNHHLLFSHSTLPSSSPPPLSLIHERKLFPLLPIAVRSSSRVKCLTKSTEEDRSKQESSLVSDSDVEEEAEIREDTEVQLQQNKRIPTTSSFGDSLSLGIREHVYEVVEVKPNGMVSTRKINRRQLLKSSGLRPRDIRSVDPSLFLTNSMPSLLVREHAILLNLGSLRAIAMQECVLIFDYNRRGGKAFIDTLLPRLNPRNSSGGPCMPFELEVVEAALLSRVQRLEQRLMNIEPRVQALLKVLPNRLTADILEELRISKQALVELGSRAGALRQMLLDLLEDEHEIRRICIMGRNCKLKGNDVVECSVPLEQQIAEEEEEEIEMLLENYLQRSESCHGQAERLLDSAKEMEDSIAVNLSSRRLEVSRVELLLQVGTFCVAVGALVAGIFGMNLKSYLEEHVFAFWLTTAGIIFGAVVAFFLMYSYLRARKIL
ncbi:PREDICTED: magnesium transporter MRS2-11, chloroplastic isoform X2 [Populus euphratica]|uniref:Magnesium transporter n=1 Tax=Populus euphratica TaxID=75702 RepID=A0AAJ6Y6S9_POPEU|nr:PREDICTED: magnesium transporter MRS2-11, chloroplastic isoform X2 [Populus euphratica]